MLTGTRSHSAHHVSIITVWVNGTSACRVDVRTAPHACQAKCCVHSTWYMSVLRRDSDCASEETAPSPSAALLDARSRPSSNTPTSMHFEVRTHCSCQKVAGVLSAMRVSMARCACAQANTSGLAPGHASGVESKAAQLSSTVCRYPFTVHMILVCLVTCP